MVWNYLSDFFASSSENKEPAKKLEIKVPPQNAEEEKILAMLEQALNNGATTLDLSEQKLTQVPPEIGQLTQLTKLYLDSNQLRTLPAEIGQLTNLTELLLWGNQLNSLPPEIGQLTNLTRLVLWNNRLSALPREIGQLTNLTEIHVYQNKLSHLPLEIAQLTKLAILDLRYNRLTTLPAGINQLISLTRLDLRENPLPIPTDILQCIHEPSTIINYKPQNIEIIEQALKDGVTELDLSGKQLTELPPQIGQLTHLTKLNLSRNELSALPAEIGQLSNLTELELWDNKLTHLPAEIGQLTNLTELLLWGNKLNSLPPEIGQLTNLTTLILWGNRLRRLPSEIGQLENLTSLSLWRNQLTTLPREISRLTNLSTLNLRENNLRKLPVWLAWLTKLTTLDLRDNPLPIPTEMLARTNQPVSIFEYNFLIFFGHGIEYSKQKIDLSGLGLTELWLNIEQFTNLIQLNLSNNQLRALPAEIAKLTTLTEIDLSNNQLSTLPAEISQLTTLTALNLSNNNFTTVPVQIEQLTNLTSLDLRGNPLPIPAEILARTDEPATIISCNRMMPLIEQALKNGAMKLDLSGLGLTMLPAQIGQLKKLVALNLSNNQLTTLPAEIWQLTSLISLDLSDNELVTLPSSIVKIKRLIILNLANNKLSTLPPEIQRLRNLRTLDLRGNPLPIPPEILSRIDEPATILQYYFKTSKIPLNEAKLVLVGQGGVGKTSLVKRLLLDEFDQNEAKTEGIKINQWRVRVDGQSIRVNVWDFGGQEIMHATHQFFLTKRALYLLVLDARQGEVASRLEYWLKLVSSFGADSPIIVVCNKIDQHPLRLNESQLRRRYPAIQAFIGTSCLSGDGLADLREKISLIMGQLPHVRDEIPRDWLAVKKALEGVAKDHLAYADYVRLCEAKLITDEVEQRDLSRLLHDLGVVLNFQDDARLKDTTVLNPSWVTEGVYQILNSKQVAQNKGLLEIGQLDEMLHAERYPREKHLFLIDMMRKFELCFDLAGHREEKFLLPDLLPVTEPVFYWPGDSLNFEYHYDFLPSSVISRVMVCLHRFLFQDKHWRHGMMLVYNKNKALLKAISQEKKITISITGPAEGRVELWTIIREHFKEIHAQITGLKPNLHIVVRGHQKPICSHCGIQNRIGAKFCKQCGTIVPPPAKTTIKYDLLLNLQQQGIQEHAVQIGDEFVRLPVSQLLSGIQPTPTVAEPEEIVNLKNLLSQFRPRVHPEKYYSFAFSLGEMYYEALDDYTLARQALMDGHEAIEDLRSLVQKEQKQEQLSKSSVKLYQMLVSCYLEEGDEDKAFEYAAIGKGRAFVNKLAEAGVKMETMLEVPDFTAKLEQVRKIRHDIGKLEEKPNLKKWRRREKQDVLLREEAELWQEMKREYPALSATLSIPSLSAMQARQLAEEFDATLLEYYHHAEGWGAFVVTANQIKYVPLPALTQKLFNRLIRWRNKVHLPVTSRYKHLSELYAAAITPLGAFDTQQLIIAPFRELHLLPLAAAYNQLARSYLIEQHVLSFVPSLTALYVLDEEQKKNPFLQKPIQQLLSVAYPGQKGAKNYLPHVLSEAEAIVKRVSKVRKVQVDSLHQQQATPSNVLQKASDYDVIHFACHGDFDPDKPHYSGLQLAGSLLTVQDIIAKLDLQRARLVTLAACLSGKVALQEGEEHVGLLQAMMTAGSKAVVASLWNVDDAATRALFTAFYGNPVRLNDPAQAMRNAVRLVRQKEKWAHPYYWAAFTVNGLSIPSYRRVSMASSWETPLISQMVTEADKMESQSDLLELINQDHESSIQRGASMNEERFIENAKLLLEYMVLEYPKYTLAALKHIKLSDEIANLDVANNEHALADAIHHLVLNNPYLQKKLLPSMHDVEQVQRQLNAHSTRAVRRSHHIEDAESPHEHEESAQVKNKLFFVQKCLIQRLETELLQPTTEDDEEDDPTESLWQRFKGMIWGGASPN